MVPRENEESSIRGLAGSSGARKAVLLLVRRVLINTKWLRGSNQSGVRLISRLRYHQGSDPGPDVFPQLDVRSITPHYRCTTRNSSSSSEQTLRGSTVLPVARCVPINGIRRTSRTILRRPPEMLLVQQLRRPSGLLIALIFTVLIHS